MESLGLQENVLFVGRIPHSQIEEWYEALDLFVLPRLDLEVSRNVTPIKPLLAMAKGVPVVASDLPAVREITGNLAQYVIPGDAVQLAKSIDFICKVEPNRQALIDWAKAHTWERNAVKYENLVEWLRANAESDKPERQ